MVRPRKEKHATSLHVSCYEEDIKFVDEHKGNMKISEYVVDAIYAFAGSSSRYDKLRSDYDALKEDYEKLKIQHMFDKTTIERLQKKSSPIIVYDPVEIEKTRNELFEKSNRVGGIIISWDKGEINWPHFIEKYKFNNKTEAEAWLKNKIDKIKNKC